MEVSPDTIFYVKFSAPLSEIRIKKIILSFEAESPASKNNIDTINAKQVRFSVSSVEEKNGKAIVEGLCFLDEQDTPGYAILFNGKESKTEINGLQFRAETSKIENKTEVGIRFKGHTAMPTGAWIKPSSTGFNVEFNGGVQPTIKGLPEGAELKAWNFEHDTLIFQDGARLLWLIGEEIDYNTKVIYGIHTDEPERLPENRIQYGFDYGGFQVKADERAANELDSIEGYRVFTRKIPKNYHVTYIVVGFNTDGTITWEEKLGVEYPEQFATAKGKE